MLRLFYNSSQKIVPLARFINTNKCYSVSASVFLQQKCYYTTADHQSTSLKSVVEQLKDRAENKSCLSNDDLNLLLMKVKSIDIVENAQALEILRLFSFLRTDENQSDIVNSIWRELKKDNVNIQVQHYNYRLHLAKNNQNVDQTQVIFDELLKDGIKPDATSYGCLLSAYCQSRNIEKVTEIIEMMQNENIHMNETSLNSLFQFNINCENIEAAMDVLKLLKNNGYKLDPYTVETLLTHYADNDDLENIEKTFKMFREENLKMFNRDWLKATPEKDSPEEINRRLVSLIRSRSARVTETVFKQLFESSAVKNDENVALTVVDLMCIDFGLQPRIPFIRENIFPCLNVNENPFHAFNQLQTTQIRIRAVIVAMIMHSLDRSDFQTAYEFATTHKDFYAIELIKQPLLKAFANTEILSNFIIFVRVIYESFAHINNYSRDEIHSRREIKQKKIEFVGEMLYAIILYLSRRYKDPNYIIRVLEAFIDEGLSISPEYAEKIRNIVDDHKKIKQLLTKLSTEPLNLKPFNIQKKPLNVISNQLSSAELQHFLDKESTLSVGAKEKQLFMAYVREENLAEIENFLAKGTFKLTEANYTSLIKLYTSNGKLANALHTLERASKDKPFFKLNYTRLGKLVELMLEKKCNLDEIETLLLNHRRDKYEFHNYTFENILDRLATNGKAELVEKLFDSFMKYNFIDANYKSTAPLVKVYLRNGSHAEAVAKYEYLIDTYKSVVMTMNLFQQLIINNEIDLLQRAYGIFEKTHGEQNALSNLAFSFIACGLDRQARAIFEEGRIQNLSKKLHMECKEFIKFQDVKSIETLLKATEDIDCNRHIIYLALLDIYIKQNNTKEAMDLWIKYSNVELSPIQPFKQRLAKLLKANKMDIPSGLEK